MWKNFNRVWASNHGWQLSGAGIIVGCAACLIWYMDWVPQIVLSKPARAPILSQTIQSQSGILVAQVIANEDSRKQKGRIQLYSPELGANQPPIYQERFTFDDRGMAAILLVVPSAEYMVVAFIDTNENGQLDFEDDKALEPFRLPITTSANSTPLESGSVESGLIQLEPQVPYLCVFDFTDGDARNRNKQPAANPRP